MGYHLVGKRVRVHLYDRTGRMVGTAEGQVSDFSAQVDVGGGMKKDLVFVTSMDYKSPHLEETGEGWFAVQDVAVVDGPILN
jgi:hypothetical protein